MGAHSAYVAQATAGITKTIDKNGDLTYWEDILSDLISRLTEFNNDTGTATGGTDTTCVDTTRAWAADIWKGGKVEIIKAGTHYFAEITTNDATTLTFASIGTPVVVGNTYQIKAAIDRIDLARINGTAVTGDDWTLRFKVLNDASVRGLMKSIGDIGPGDNIVTILGNILTAIGLLAMVPTTPTIYNSSLLLADTEYSQALSANTKKFSVSIIDGQAGDNFRIAYVTGKVATPTAPYLKYEQNIEFYQDNIEAAALTLYLASSKAGVVAQIEEWV